MKEYEKECKKNKYWTGKILICFVGKTQFYQLHTLYQTLYSEPDSQRLRQLIIETLEIFKKHSTVY